jgi:hypothetical protein
MLSAIPSESASVAEYAFAERTVASSGATGRPRRFAMLRMNAAASSVAFFESVLGRSAPPVPTTAAAPMFVAGAIASSAADEAMNVPAEAAWAPSGAT